MSRPRLTFRDRFVPFIRQLQADICSALEIADGSGKTFQPIHWERPGGGGGESRIFSGGRVFEKGGVNISIVEGELTPLLQEKLKANSKEFFATGISLVIHPFSPKVPTVHANFRYFEQPDRAWFGGGADLTPYTLNVEDFGHFHRVWREACSVYGPDAYEGFKRDCDDYFRLHHRDEARGVGGIFFDYLAEDLEKTFTFIQTCGRSFLESYLPIVERRKEEAFTERQKKFQLLRRGRYVEFNLLHDRGTLFGIQTRGNSESILMSLPPVVHFDTLAPMEETEEERQLLEWFRRPRAWV